MADKYDIILQRLDPTTGNPDGDPQVLEVYEDKGAPHPSVGGRTMAWQNCFVVYSAPHTEE